MAIQVDRTNHYSMTAFKMSQICTENVCYMNRLQFFCSNCYNIKRVLQIFDFIIKYVLNIIKIPFHIRYQKKNMSLAGTKIRTISCQFFYTLVQGKNILDIEFEYKV